MFWQLKALGETRSGNTNQADDNGQQPKLMPIKTSKASADKQPSHKRSRSSTGDISRRPVSSRPKANKKPKSLSPLPLSVAEQVIDEIDGLVF